MGLGVAKKMFAPALLGLFMWSSPAAAFDFTLWDGLLKKYVSPKSANGVVFHSVDYPAMKKDPRYKRLISDLRKFSPESLKSREQKLAFWINLYNIFAVKVVQDNYPLKSIKDAGSFFSPVWKKTAGVVGGKDITLDEIEHEILRKMGEPRIHIAIVCASVSCPDLRTEAYTEKKLNAQLDDQMKSLLANRGKGLHIDRQKGKIYISSIFKWFKKDFESSGGVVEFITPYSPEQDRKYLKGKNYKVSYLDYDWGLNAIQD